MGGKFHRLFSLGTKSPPTTSFTQLITLSGEVLMVVYLARFEAVLGVQGGRKCRAVGKVRRSL